MQEHMGWFTVEKIVNHIENVVKKKISDESDRSIL